MPPNPKALTSHRTPRSRTSRTAGLLTEQETKMKAYKISAVVSLFLLFGVAAGVKPQPQKVPPFKVASIKAMLFYEDKGTFSKDVLADPNFALWNAIIGGGSAEGNSSSTLVIVELASKAEAYDPTRKIEFTATYKTSGKNARPLAVKRTSDTGIFNKQGRFFAALWLYDTGCEPIKLSARIFGQAQPSSLNRTIEFRCGE